MRYILVIILVGNIFINAFGQSVSCTQLRSQFLEEYQDEVYAEALESFQKYTKCTKGTEIDYYVGARIAALKGNRRLALKYLKKSTKLGFYDVQKAKQDEHLASIKSHRKFKSILAKMQKNNQKFAQKLKLSKIQIDKMKSAIPYQEEGKWGWLDPATLQPLTKAMFDYTDFYTGGKLVFILNRQVYHWKDGVVTTAPTYANGQHTLVEPTKVKKIRARKKAKKNKKIQGFELDDEGDLVSYSSNFMNVNLIDEDFVPSERIAIATNKDGLSGVIKGNGEPIEGLEIKFYEVSHFGKKGNVDLFAIKEKRGGKFIIYDENGQVVYNTPMDYYYFMRSSQIDPSGSLIYIGENDYVIASNNNKLRVLDKNSLKKILSKDYDNIELYNGPTDNSLKSDLSSKNRRSPFLKEYFLVKDGGNTFYVDKEGTEYKPL